MIDQKIGFIGAGQMARALARGFVDTGLVAAKRVWASDPAGAAQDEFATQVPGATVVADNRQVAAETDVLFLAVKPQQMAAMMDDLGGVLTDRHLVVSIAAGVPLAQIAAASGDGVRLIRVMPNTACLVGRSASGYCLGPGATDADAELVGQLLSAVGMVHRLDEKLLDAVTGLAGSGIAFAYVVIEALSDGGVLMGLPRSVATEMAVQTLGGAADMVLQSGEHTGRLIDRVTSPGGTTIAGLDALEEGGIRAALISAVRAATERSAELGKLSEGSSKKDQP